MFLIYDSYLRFLYDSKKWGLNYIKGFSYSLFSHGFSNRNYWETSLKEANREPWLETRGII